MRSLGYRSISLLTSRTDEPALSVIIVTVDRPRLVERCVASLLAQTEPNFEAVVVLNGATPRIEQMIRRLAADDQRVRLVTCAPCTASEARNVGLSAAHGAVLYFIDDDVEVPPHGLRAVLDVFAAHDDVTIAGGPNLTPSDDPDFCQMAGELLASSFGTGITHHRYAAQPEGVASERHLTLCNLAVRRRLFDSGERFPLPFGGEENVLMGRATRLGYGLWYSPELWVHHHRRATLGAHLDQVRRYGFGRGIAIHAAPGTFHLAYFAPVGLLVGVVVAIPSALLGAPPVVLAPLGVYVALAVLATVGIAAKRRRPGWLVRLPPLFALTHLAYALGLLRGLRRGFHLKRASSPSLDVV